MAGGLAAVRCCSSRSVHQSRIRSPQSGKKSAVKQQHGMLAATPIWWWWHAAPASARPRPHRGSNHGDGDRARLIRAARGRWRRSGGAGAPASADSNRQPRKGGNRALGARRAPASSRLVHSSSQLRQEHRLHSPLLRRRTLAFATPFWLRLGSVPKVDNARCCDVRPAAGRAFQSFAARSSTPSSTPRICV